MHDTPNLKVIREKVEPTAVDLKIVRQKAEPVVVDFNTAG